MEQQITTQLRLALAPVHLQVINESHLHKTGIGKETHFKLIVVSNLFAEKNLLQRHRLIYQILANELADSIHALSMHLFTPTEWSEQGQPVIASPPCQRRKK